MSVNKAIEINPNYVYVTIPKEYICIYHRILAMLADYGEEMLKDCKANCTDKNSGVIECFNMFNAAVAAHTLNKNKLAALLINYIKAKINQIYKNFDNSTDFVFPVDEHGQIKAFVSCGETPILRISEEDMKLYQHKYGAGFDEHFKLGAEDGYLNPDTRDTGMTHSNKGLDVSIYPIWEHHNTGYVPCVDIQATYAGEIINIEDTIYQQYFDFTLVKNFSDITTVENGLHTFTVVMTYKDETKIVTEELIYGVS